MSRSYEEYWETPNFINEIEYRAMVFGSVAISRDAALGLIARYKGIDRERITEIDRMRRSRDLSRAAYKEMRLALRVSLGENRPEWLDFAVAVATELKPTE